jgi:hypothetical protein
MKKIAIGHDKRLTQAQTGKIKRAELANEITEHAHVRRRQYLDQPK